MLKKNWERCSELLKLDVSLLQRMIQAWQPCLIKKVSILSVGCANTNYKIEFHDGSAAVVLRIYTRDEQAARIEQQLLQKLAGKVPIAETLYLNTDKNIIDYPYAIHSFIDGELMRSVILKGDESDIAECAYAAGKCLNQLQQFKFIKAGFFDANLSVIEFETGKDFQFFILELLNDETVQSKLGDSLTDSLKSIVIKNSNLLFCDETPNLVHADFDPSNMLVKKIDDHWQVVALLDWEFALATTSLLDMGLMLRFSHQLPSCYETSFIKAMIDSGMQLPKHWKKTIKLIDMLSLLQLLKISENRTNLTTDVIKILEYTAALFN